MKVAKWNFFYEIDSRTNGSVVHQQLLEVDVKRQAVGVGVGNKKHTLHILKRDYREFKNGNMIVHVSAMKRTQTCALQLSFLTTADKCLVAYMKYACSSIYIKETAISFTTGKLPMKSQFTLSTFIET